MSVGVCGSLIQGVVNEAVRLPYANFGDSPIHLMPGQRLGILEPCPGAPIKCDAFLGLAEVFQGLPPVTQDAPANPPSGHPYLIEPPDLEPPDITKAKISDHWGPKYRKQVEQLLH